MKTPRTAAAAIATASSAALSPAAAQGQSPTPVKPYLQPVGNRYAVTPLLSAGDEVPNRSNPNRDYQMVGVPDGLGLAPGTRGGRTLYMNHELGNGVLSEPNVAGFANRGAIISKFSLGRSGSVTSGQRAYSTVFQENQRVGPAAQIDNLTPGFGRFCSGFLAGTGVGFDRPIYLTGEESQNIDGQPTSTFDGRGGQAVAVFDDELHTLPALGRFPKENAVVLPGTGRRTVVMVMEDGPRTPDSQLWMYVGHKDPTATDVLGRNGLRGGRLYALAIAGKTNEAEVQADAVRGRWVEVPGAEALNETELEAAADRVGAFGFIRVEDGASSDTRPGEFYFNTTGDAEQNRLGRVYQLNLNAGNPLRTANLRVISNADVIVAAGGDTALSPDNLDVSGDVLMVQEDGTAATRPVMAAKGRDGSVWRFDLRRAGTPRERVAELSPPGDDDTPVGPGVWESSGIIATDGFLGSESWILDVQAHPPTAAPGSGTVEDGQLLVMRRARR